MKVFLNKVRALYIVMLGGLLSIAIVSCSDDIYNDSEFVAGETFTNSNIRLILIDTLTVSTSTMKFDSIVTSESTRILLGKYTDTVFGIVTASSYMQFLPDSYTIDSEAEFDSIVMVLGYDQYYYNDTLQKNSIHIKKINENFNPESDDFFYNTSSIGYEENDLGFKEYHPRPLAGDSITIKLVDDFGTDVFSKLQEKDIVNADEYRDYFKGIGMIPDDETIRKAVKMKHPVTYTHPNSNASMGYKKLAANLLGEQYEENLIKRDGLFSYMMKLMGLR
jgi:hypothetical protein